LEDKQKKTKAPLKRTHSKTAILMLRVFVYEFTCAAAPSGIAAPLCAEGEAMLSAALADFGRVSGIEAFAIRSEADKPAAFRSAARRADWSLVIAPEFDGLLEQRCRWALEAGSRLLGPSPETVALCADKLALARHWLSNGVHTPPTITLEERPTKLTQWIVKPRFGAGSLDTVLNGELKSTSEIGPMIVQPFLSGRAASVAFLCGPAARLALPPAEQILSADGRFRYLGGRLPLPADLASRAVTLAWQAIDRVPGLCGYIGVDLVLGDDGRDWAIEINPRLTTSYIGLRALAESNLAEAMLEIAAGAELRPLRWRSGTVEFSAQGQCRRL
jgi:predicted ATP-grasp superfamily ATP-dependent carboligase